HMEHTRQTPRGGAMMQLSGEAMKTEAITETLCDELTRQGFGRVARVLLDVADRGVDIKATLLDLPIDGLTLFIETTCWGSHGTATGLMTPEERSRLVATDLRVRLRQHCGCGDHNDGATLRSLHIDWYYE